jgi:CRISPR-associated endonuclease/helicase Cas3
VSWTKPDGLESRAFAAVRSQRVHLHWLSESASIGEYLQNALAGGGCAAVICNTVTSAQNLYRDLRQFFSPENLDLFHARFPFGARQEREARVLRDFGQSQSAGESTGIRLRRVLVATQVIEQSLDIDFDLMISELAPVDLLLQRAGRLHRHARQRPVGLEEPHLAILGPSAGTSDVPDWGASGMVYWPHTLLRTWLAIRDRSLVTIPHDLEELIEAVYDERAPTAELNEFLKEEWRTTQAAMEESQRDSVFNADRRRIGRPSGERQELREIWNRPREYDEDAAGAALRALTREADETVEVACFLRTPEGLRADLSGEVVRVDIRPTDDVVELVLRQTLQLSFRSVVFRLREKPTIPSTWAGVSLLSQIHLLEFDSVSRKNEEFGLTWSADLGIHRHGH